MPQRKTSSFTSLIRSLLVYSQSSVLFNSMQRERKEEEEEVVEELVKGSLTLSIRDKTDGDEGIGGHGEEERRRTWV